jgi:hypothetical protein
LYEGRGSGELVPGFAGSVDDAAVSLEDAVREPVGPQILPNILDRVQFGRARGQQDQRHVLGDRKLVSRVPASAVEEENGVRAAGDGAADLVDMGLHGLGICEGHGERRADATRRTDGAEQIGAIIALVGWLARAGATPGPLPDDPVLLSDPGFVLEPDLDPFALGDVGEMRLQGRREVFLNASMVVAFWPGWRGRALTWEKPICFRSLPIVRS